MGASDFFGWASVTTTPVPQLPFHFGQRANKIKGVPQNRPLRTQKGVCTVFLLDCLTSHLREIG
ncbi:MAG: hypothetical protein KGI27_14000, partial [Thaumarchaeota archaeon]|nr:hypothetical protein [Nitrososphaerota archaeon]